MEERSFYCMDTSLVRSAFVDNWSPIWYMTSLQLLYLLPTQHDPKRSPTETNPPRNHHGHGPRCQWTSRHSTLPSPNSCARMALCASWAPTRRIWSFGTFSSVVFDKEFDGEGPWLKQILFLLVRVEVTPIYVDKYVEVLKTKSWLMKYL